MRYAFLIFVGLLDVIGVMVGYNFDYLTHEQAWWGVALGMITGAFGAIGMMVTDW